MSGITILGQYKPLTLREDTASKNYFFFRPDDKLVDHEEEISIQDNVVIWTAGQVVKRKITLEHRVVQVVWANFSADPTNTSKTDLCILHQEGLYVLVDQGGSSYWDVHVSLPCKVTALWAVHRGVILQRRTSPSETQQLPVYFSLLHPLEELKPLAFGEDTRLGDTRLGDTRLGEGTAPTHDMVLVACSELLPHVVFFHERRQQHSVWLLRCRADMQRELTYDLATQQDALPSDGEQLQSELYLELIYLEDCASRATQLVLVQDRELGLHYAVYCPAVHELRTWRIDHVTALSPGRLTRQHVHAIQPLHGVAQNAVLIGDRSTQVASHVMLVVQDSAKSRDWLLVVQAVQHQICAWPVAEYFNIPVHAIKPRRSATPLVLTPTRTPRKGESLTRVMQPSVPELEHVTIEDSIDTRFNVVVQFRAMDPLIYRATISLAPRSVLTRDALSALRGVVPPQLYDHTVRVLLLEADLSGGDEWLVFVSFMKQLFRTHLLQVAGVAANNSAQDTWSALLSSSRHRHHVEGNFLSKLRKPLPSLVNLTDSHVTLDAQHVQAFTPYLSQIYHALHLVYEDYKLDQLKIAQLSALATLLLELSVVAQCHAYTDHYLRDIPQLYEHVLAVQHSLTPVKRVAEFIPYMATPPSIYFWLMTALRHPDNIPPYPLLTGVTDSPFEVTRALCRVYHVILTSRDHAQYCPAVPPRLHVTDSFDGPMPPFMNAPVQHSTEAVHEWTHVLTEEANLLEISLPFGVAQLLHEALASVRHVPPRDCPARLLTALDRLDLLALYYPSMLPPKKVLTSAFDPSQSPADLPESRDRIDGTELSNEVSFMRFAKDTRLKEVRRLFRSSHVFTVHYGHEDGTEDLAQGQQVRLLLHANKYLARTVARGMFTLGTDTQLKPLFSESIPIPELSTTAKFRPQGTTVTLDLTPHPDLLHWPEFHNGASAALRVPSELSAQITSTWLIYQKNTAELTNGHAGLLLALGLQGHLRALSLTKVYEYLSVSHELTGIALLLGVAASKLGTQDTAISRLLSVHVTALHPPLSQELDVPFRLQTAALLALGMLYRGTCHRRITEVLLTEIGRKPVEEKQQARPFERESHSLTAGLALGLVVLARADSAAGLHDLDIQQRLLRYITGGPSDQRSDTRTSLLSQRASDRARSSTVLEGTSINVDITAPGAVLALALLYLKSRDRSVAARIDIPDTCFAFQYIRPDLVLLRVLAKNLILWDDIQPTAAWIEGHVPSVMTGVKAQLGREIESGDTHQTLRQGYFNVLTGACLAIGFRFAGTAHSAAKQVLTQYLQYFIKLQRSKFDRADKNMLEYCMNSVALALSMVMSGTGHLATFKILRTLRKRVSVDVTYGNHMALNMAIGFLFLGGGRYTLDTSPQSIAFLLCAVYPRYPQNSRDNRYHLQALRHLYALAAVPRCIEVRDVDTQRPVYVPLNIHFRPDFDTSEHVIQLTAPCLLPPVQWITKIELATPRYWSLTLSRDRHAATHPLTLVCNDTCQRSPVLHVKRKSAYLDYDLDPDGVKSLSARPYSQTLRLDNLTAVGSVLDAKNRRELLLAFSADPHVLAFATHFASGNDTRQVAFCTAVLLECLSAEKLTMIDTYLTLDRVVQCLTRDTALSASELYNVKLICQLYTRTDWPWLTADTSPLLQIDYLTSVKLKLENYFENWTRRAGLSRNDWLELAKKGYISSREKQSHVTPLQLYYEVPPPVTLQHVLDMPRPDSIAHWTLFLAPLTQFSELHHYDANTVLFLAHVLSGM